LIPVLNYIFSIFSTSMFSNDRGHSRSGFLNPSVPVRGVRVPRWNVNPVTSPSYFQHVQQVLDGDSSSCIYSACAASSRSFFGKVCRQLVRSNPGSRKLILYLNNPCNWLIQKYAPPISRDIDLLMQDLVPASIAVKLTVSFCVSSRCQDSGLIFKVS